MKIRQLSIFLENKAGRLAGVINVLGEAGIDILAISVADTADFGILRLIVKDIDRAQKVLNDQAIVCGVNNVTVVEVEAVPGSLGKVLDVLNKANVNIEYMYAIAQTKSVNPLMVFRFVETAEAISAMEAAGIKLLSEDTLFA
jgi:hypothetical protein